MHDDKRKQPFPRDRKGEIFQDDLGEDQSTAFPPMRDDAAHDLNLKPDDVDSEESDEFMKRHFEKGAVEKSTSENPPEPRRR